MAKRVLVPDEDARIADIAVSCKHDPYKFVVAFFPWGEKGSPLEEFEGPDEWQTKLLKEVRDGLKTTNQAVQEAVASGHGTGSPH